MAEAAAAAAVEEDSEDEDIWEEPVVFPFQPPVEEAAAVAEADWADAVDENPIDDDDWEWADPLKSESEEF